MEQIYNKKMNELGYEQFVCDIFLNWEDVKDEILLPERKEGSGNGTVHVFLGAADECLKKEFPGYYKAVTEGEDPSVGAIKITHYFVKSNVLSMLGYVCEYCRKKNVDFSVTVTNILSCVDNTKQVDGMLSTSSLLKLSTGSNKLRPYFKQFDSKGIFHHVIRQLLLPNSAYKIALYKNANDEYAAFWLIGFGDLDDFMADVNSDNIEKPLNELKKCEKCLQQIFYGAPGTGKSFKIKRDTKNQSKIRTTFHPDSDYSTFVGCYKPTMNEDVKYDKEGNEKSCTKQIEYAFVPQAFLKAYVKAWKFYCSAEDGTAKAQYLIIEEINRGNCAQIFGDLFQLLDRNEDGYSTYPIVADTDIQKYLSKEFEKVNFPDSLNAIYDDYDGNIVEDIKNGIVLALPNNLYIWATMNTSDQSLFPIDSAFKRRWDWKYMPIDTKKENWNIEVDGKKYSWSDFLEAVNEQIFEVTKSEDKKLGFYFCRANNHVVDAEKFVGKVIFYLYNDVFKDYGYDRKMFQGEDGKTIQFHEYFQSNGDINEQKAALFLNNLEINPIGENNVE